MAKRKAVSEKSLELNICAEMLQHIRSWPGCRKALWLGLTQSQERRLGIDELIRNVGHGFSLMLQFKAPWPTSQVDSLYKFSINEQQHYALEQLAVRFPGSVFYVFPLYSEWAKANLNAPNLSRDTWLVPVSTIPFASLTSSSVPSARRHRVELERTKSWVKVTAYSPEVNGEAANAWDFLANSIRPLPLYAGTVGVPSGELQEWFERWNYLRFRRLHALFVPA